MQSALRAAESIGALPTFAIETCAKTGLTIPECHCWVCAQALYRAHRRHRPVRTLAPDAGARSKPPARAPL